MTSGTSLVDFSMKYFGMPNPDSSQPLNMDSNTSQPGGEGFMWLHPEATNAELSDAAGGITLSNFSQGWQRS